jgi:hypothetical protein
LTFHYEHAVPPAETVAGTLKNFDYLALANAM